jgi:hypothetical protein
MACKSTKTGCDDLRKSRQCNMSRTNQMFAHMQVQKHLRMQGMEQPLPGLVLFPNGRQSADNSGQDTPGLPGLLDFPTPTNNFLGCLLSPPSTKACLRAKPCLQAGLAR